MKKLKIKKLSNKLILIVTCLTLGIILSSCDPTDALKLNNNCEKSWTKMIENEFNAYSNALNAYGADPSTENCNNVKKTGNDYIDALKDVEKCVALNKEQWKKDLEEGRKQLNNLNCD